jgi:hypothetical protein
MEVLTPKSPRWSVFADTLSQTLIISATTWRCDGDQGPNVHRYAKQIMGEMGNIDIPASVAGLKHLGGYCDCEILLNVDPDDRSEVS